ncbi:MAG: type II toxin-antitoxin system RelE/ParE family toxin [Verrucomicrobia bacterium]|nr:type II toxin-antitoxin system RelE/ParE family toxin [Verrucomicrobiota bacterium]MDA1085479.1 type II toxin-antitoxin system RelE/ParE family toxin [Verrucomicrobiota bacterium]
MTHRVYVTDEAGKDLLDIWEYVMLHDVPGRADQLLDRLEQTCRKLVHSPEKGHQPPELARIGVDLYREVHYKPYRIIYEVSGRDVFVHAVLDGRRDLQSVLERRLLR